MRTCAGEALLQVLREPRVARKLVLQPRIDPLVDRLDRLVPLVPILVQEHRKHAFALGSDHERRDESLDGGRCVVLSRWALIDRKAFPLKLVWLAAPSLRHPA